MHAYVHTKHTCSHKTHTHKQKQYMHTYTGVGRSYILCSLKGPTFCSVSSTACVCPAGQPVDSEDFTDRKSHQCWSHKCQVSLLELCIFIYPPLSLSPSFPSPSLFAATQLKTEAEKWARDCQWWYSSPLLFLCCRGQNPLHILGQYGKDNAAAMFELFRETMPEYPIDRPDAEGNTGEDIIVCLPINRHTHRWGHHSQAIRWGHLSQALQEGHHSWATHWGHHSQTPQVRTSFSGNTGEGIILRQHRWGQHSQATQVMTPFSGNTGEDIILRQHRWGHHAVCWPIDWSDTESNTSEDMHRHHSVLTLLIDQAYIKHRWGHCLVFMPLADRCRWQHRCGLSTVLTPLTDQVCGGGREGWGATGEELWGIYAVFSPPMDQIHM